MLDRLIGLETEYAIRASPPPGQKRPGNFSLYRLVLTAIERLVHSSPGRTLGGLESRFTENGGAFCYEFLPSALDGGLLEGRTPECRGPSELLLFQRAQERLLVRAMDDARTSLRLDPAPLAADLGLIKNCRDAQGRIYGAQENYEVPLARGPWLWLYRLGLLVLVPGVLLATIATWTLLLLLVLLGLALAPLLVIGAVVTAFSPSRTVTLERLLAEDGAVIRVVTRALSGLELVISVPVATALALLLRAVAFRRLRRDALGFLVTRSVVTGAGSLEPDGSFALSEKGLALRSVMRTAGTSHSRSIIDTGNLLKGVLAPAGIRLSPFLDLFRRRQRLQLGLSDANMAQVAEYLKVGTTCLVLDMSEAGALEGAPRPRRPVEAVGRLVRDPTLSAAVELRDGRTMTALEVQRWYLERAQRFIAETPTPSLEAREVVRLWAECLEALAEDPGRLVGRIDWVTKRWLIEETASGAEPAARKKIDLKYHELGQGYFAQLEAMGLAPRLVDEAEAERAWLEPPERTPARIRGRLVRELAGQRRVSVDWRQVRVGGRLGRVIRLDDYR